MGLIYQEHRPMSMGDLGNLCRIRRQAKIVGGGQKYGLQVRLFLKSLLHLLRGNLEAQPPGFAIAGPDIHRCQIAQYQPAHYRTVGIAGNQDFVPRVQSPQQHPVNNPGGAVHPQKAAISMVHLGCLIFQRLDAAGRMMDIVQFLHKRNITFQCHRPCQMH